MASNKLAITALIAVKNEAANLARCLRAIRSLKRIVVLDSHSTDGTPDIAARHGAEVIQFDYRGGYPKKRQWALAHVPIATPWTLLLDADEVVSDDLVAEITTAVNSPNPAAGYLLTKGFHFLGRRFRFGGFSHAAVALFQTGKARFEQLIEEPADALDMEVHERLLVDGPVARLRTPLIHEDFKGLQAYLDRHNKYSTWEARVRHQFLTTGRWGAESIQPRLLGNVQERRRWLNSIVMRLPAEPWLWFAYHFILRGGLLEGRRGLIASLIRAHYISDVRAKAYELSLQTPSPSPGASLPAAAKATMKASPLELHE
jgi:hypothetical protein